MALSRLRRSREQRSQRLADAQLQGRPAHSADFPGLLGRSQPGLQRSCVVRLPHASPSDAHRHMAHPSDGIGGSICPSTHPVRLPQLGMELLYGIDEFADDWHLAKNTSWPFVWASGNASPYGLHADFIYGWDNSTFHTANDQCTNDASVRVSRSLRNAHALRARSASTARASSSSTRTTTSVT